MKSQTLATEIKKLSLKKGDILIIKRGFNTVNWSELLQEAGKDAGIDFDVPLVFVDDIDDVAVVRLGQEK